MRYKVYFGLTVVFTLLMIVINLTFEYYISLASFTWRIDVIFYLLSVITLLLGILQFDLKNVEIGKKYHHKWVLTLLPVTMTYYVLSNILTREYDLLVLIGLIALSLLVFFGVIYMFVVSFIIKKDDGLIASHILKPKRKEINYDDIITIETNMFVGLIVKTEETTCFLHVLIEGTMDILVELSSRLDKELYSEPFKKLAKLFKILGMNNNYNLINTLISECEEEKESVEEKDQT